MNVFCPQCGVAIAAKDVNVCAKAAVCAACDSVFDVRGAVGGERPIFNPFMRVRQRRPWYFQVSNRRHRLLIRWSWFSIVLIPFGIIGVGCSLAGSGMCYRSMAENAGYVSLASGAVFCGLGLVTVIVVIGIGINRTDIIVTQGELRIRHRPIPFYKGVTIPLEAIEQLFCQKVEGRSSGEPEKFQLMARLKNGDTRLLVDLFDKIGHARFVEQRLEARMGIRPRRVEGEFVGDESRSLSGAGDRTSNQGAW